MSAEKLDIVHFFEIVDLLFEVSVLLEFLGFAPQLINYLSHFQNLSSIINQIRPRILNILLC